MSSFTSSSLLPYPAAAQQHPYPQQTYHGGTPPSLPSTTTSAPPASPPPPPPTAAPAPVAPSPLHAASSASPASSVPAPSMSTSSSNDPADLLLTYFPEASKLSRDDLEEMLRSPDYFDAFFGTLPQARALYEEHAELLRANKELAEKNMALKARHEGLRAETQTAFDEAKALQKRWHEQILPTQASAYKRFSAPVQLPRLRQGLGDQERLSESLISELLDESINPDEFIRSFKQVRTLAYRRSVMVDKWIGGQVNWDD